MFGRETKQDELKAQAYGKWLRQRHPFAIASLVLGVFSLSHLGTLIIDSLAAIALGIVAIHKLREPNRAYSAGARLAIIGIAAGALSLIIASILYLRGMR